MENNVRLKNYTKSYFVASKISPMEHHFSLRACLILAECLLGCVLSAVCSEINVRNDES